MNHDNQIDPTEGLSKPQINPLSQYFRHAKISIQLPSGGDFWPEGSLELNDDGTLDIFPMTARDEIIMKSPDGLLSGASIIKTIASCIPGIKDPTVIPGPDVDTILVAIRLASFDHSLEISPKCPHCNEINDYKIDLRVLLDSISKEKIQNVDKIDDLTFELQPYTFGFINKNNKTTFDQEQLVKTLADPDMTPEKKTSEFEKIFSKLADHTDESLVIAISRIILPDGKSIADKAMIRDFINNCDRDMAKKIRDAIGNMNSLTAIPEQTVICGNEDCKKSFTRAIEFNQSNFFE